MRKEKLKIKGEHKTGNDFLIALFCNDLQEPKTIYIENNQVETVMNYHWNSLNANVSLINIDLPFKEKWFARISATNEKTENKCNFYTTKVSDFIDKLSFYIPENQFFYDYQIHLQTKLLNNNNNFRRYIFYDIYSERFQVDNLLIPDFNYDIVFLDQDGFEISLEEKYNDFFILYSTLSYKPAKTRYNENMLVMSNWEVISNSSDEIEFQFPSLDHLYNEFHTIKSVSSLRPRTIGLLQKIDNDKSFKIIDYSIDKE